MFIFLKYHKRPKIANVSEIAITFNLFQNIAMTLERINVTLERIRNFFLEPKQRRKEFLKLNPNKQRDVLISLLWNAEIENKKIANISFKQPFDVLSKMENKDDFNSMRRGRDSNPGPAFTSDGFQDRSIRPLWHLSF